MSASAGLPDILDQITDLTDVATARRVAQAKGGTVAYFPKPGNLAAQHWLVEAVGMEAARKIAEAFGGDRILIPFGNLAGQRARVREAVINGLAEGMSTRAIAASAGIHDKTVRRIKRKLADEDLL